LFSCDSLAIIFYSEHVEIKKNNCETTKDKLNILSGTYLTEK